MRYDIGAANIARNEAYYRRKAKTQTCQAEGCRRAIRAIRVSGKDLCAIDGLCSIHGIRRATHGGRRRFPVEEDCS